MAATEWPDIRQLMDMKLDKQARFGFDPSALEYVGNLYSRDVGDVTSRLRRRESFWNAAVRALKLA